MSQPTFTEEQFVRILRKALPSHEGAQVDLVVRGANESLGAHDIGYFNPCAEDNALLGRYIIYNDVHVFTERLLLFAKDFTDARVHRIVPACLRGPAYHWHSYELTSVERECYTRSSMATFCDALIAQFKVDPGVALQSLLQMKNFSMADLRSGLTLYAHTRKILRLAKAAELSVHTQLLLIWITLDAGMQLHIPKPTINTKQREFLVLLDSRENTLRDLDKQRKDRQALSNKPIEWNRDRQPRLQRDVSGTGGSWEGDRATGNGPPGYSNAFPQTSYQFRNAPYGTPGYNVNVPSGQGLPCRPRPQKSDLQNRLPMAETSTNVNASGSRDPNPSFQPYSGRARPAQRAYMTEVPEQENETHPGIFN